MPIPPLPNELISLIFEHLFRLLSVHPAEEFLDVPETAPFVFGRLSQVSRTWNGLAGPYVVRHLDAEQMLRVRDAAPDKLADVRSARWSRGHRAGNRLDEGVSWRWAAETSAATIQQLFFPRNFPPLAADAFFGADAIVLPALRRLTLDLSGDRQFKLLRLLSLLATRAPQIEHLTLLSHEFYLQPPTPTSPSWQLAHLRVLDLRNFHVKPEWLRPVLVDSLVKPSRRTLEYLFLDVSVRHKLGEPCSTLFPFSFPNLVTFRCTSRDIDCESVDLSTTFPRVVDLTLSLIGPSPTLPLIPPSIQHLAVSCLRKSTFTNICTQVTQTLSSLPSLRTLGIGLHDFRTPDPLPEAVEAVRALVAVADSRGVTFHSDFLSYVSWADDEDDKKRFGKLPKVQVRGINGWASEVEAGGQEVDEEEKEEEEEVTDGEEAEGEDQGEGVEAERGEEAEEGEEGEAEIGWHDWDAEDDPVFRSLWSQEKRDEYDAANPYTRVTLRLA
ncbi:hypothetical protein JCM6882_009219 [Rhodosporidiobolus microsporus]